jgi:uncharacterized membrane protein
MEKTDYIALVIFAICWLGYEPLLRTIGTHAGLISKHISVLRQQWMRNFISRDVKLFDSNLLGHSVNSASFFASANLILIAAIAGAIFEGNISRNIVSSLGMEASSRHVLDFKFAIILLCLARGFFNFTWAIRQMNYCAAAMGAVPHDLTHEEAEETSSALAQIVEPAMSHLSQGVRGYYFSIAAAMWLYGPIFLIIGSLGAISLLLWRQSASSSAGGLKALRGIIEKYHRRKNGE